MKTNFKNKLTLLLLVSVMLIGNLFVNSLQTKAATVTSTSIAFDEHSGMVVHINGVGDAFCIERGYPFRTRVADLQSFYVTRDGETKTLAAFIRENLNFTFVDGVHGTPGYFAGWGYYKLNSDHTGLINITTSSQMKNVPSSGAWNENFDEETVDGEDRYTSGKGNSGIYNFDTVTGHEGAKDK